MSEAAPPEIGQPAITLPGISVITLGVTDIERSERFYMDGFGLEHARPAKGIIYFKLAGALLALFARDDLARYAGVEPTSPGGFAGATLSCNVAARSEVDALAARAAAAGATVIKAPEIVSWGGYCAWIADPDDYLWELVWNPKWSGEARGRLDSHRPPDASRRVVHRR